MSSPPLALTPPYFVVVFSSRRTAGDQGYSEMAERMEKLAGEQPGYLGIETARGQDGFGITVSYWRDMEAIRNWKAQVDHLAAQRRGKDAWYSDYRVRIGRIDREYGSD